MTTHLIACIARRVTQRGVCNMTSSAQYSIHVVFDCVCCVFSCPLIGVGETMLLTRLKPAFLWNSFSTSCVVSQGQGMTVGMMGSNLLCQCIDNLLEGWTADNSKQQQLAALDSLPAQFHIELGALLNYPWSVAAGPDAMCALSCLAKDKAWCSCSLRKCTSCTGNVSAVLLLLLYML